jgi:hypothetical protein
VSVVRVTIDRDDLAHLQMVMRALPRRVAIKTLRVALNAWGGIVKDKAKSLARRDTGLLAKSIGVKVTIPDASRNTAHHGKPAYVVVGPKRKSGRFMRRTNRGSLVGFGKAQKELKANREFFKTSGARALARERLAVKLTRKQFNSAIYRNPTRYAHLVEKGHSRAKAYPFIAPAQQAGNTAGWAKFKSKLREGIETEARQLAATN